MAFTTNIYIGSYNYGHIFVVNYASLLVLLILLTTTQVQPSLGGETQDHIKVICSRVLAHQFCNDFFRANLPWPEANIQDLVDVTLRKALLHATDTSTFIKRLMARAPPRLRDIFAICDVCFNAITGEYVDIQFDFKRKDLGILLDDIVKAQRPSDDCRHNSDGQPELNRRATTMRNFIDLSYVIANYWGEITR